MTPSHVASSKNGCQNFSYVYRSRKHQKCNIYLFEWCQRWLFVVAQVLVRNGIVSCVKCNHITCRSLLSHFHWSLWQHNTEWHVLITYPWLMCWENITFYSLYRISQQFYDVMDRETYHQADNLPWRKRTRLIVRCRVKPSFGDQKLSNVLPQMRGVQNQWEHHYFDKVWSGAQNAWSGKLFLFRWDFFIKRSHSNTRIFRGFRCDISSLLDLLPENYLYHNV